MGRCSNIELMHKIGLEKITEQTEVTFTVNRDIDNCEVINTRNNVSEITDYSSYDRPENLFDCDGGYCATTGTLYVKAAESPVKFYHAFDATQYANGVITFYLKDVPEGAIVNVTISDASTFTNADTYNVTAGAATNGYTPIVVELGKVPDSTVGTGWAASTTGAYLSVGVNDGNDPVAFGISTITFYRWMGDLATNNIVKIGCLSEVGGTFDLSALEETCLTKGYDTSTPPSFDWTVTGKLLTTNYWMLNPLSGMDKFPKQADEYGFKPVTVKRKIGEGGEVLITDMNQDVCDFIGAQIDDKCVYPNADVMDRIMAPVPVTLDYNQFQVSLGESGATFRFNTALVGQDVLITYPQIIEDYEIQEGNLDNVGSVRVKMGYPVKLSDGTEEYHVFNNVLVTSFPATISSEEQDVTFTINVQRDSDGNYFVIQRYNRPFLAPTGGR